MLGALVILWAVVLVPMWLKRHDKLNELAAVDRFAGAMRVLSRRSGRGGGRAALSSGRYVMMPARSAAARVPHVSRPQEPEPRQRRRESTVESDSAARDFEMAASDTAEYRERPPVTVAAREDRRQVTARVGSGQRGVAREAGARASRLAQRRRLVLAMLAGFLLTLVLALALGGMFIALQAFTDVLVLAGLAHLRAEVISERARRSRRQRRVPVAPVRDEAPEQRPVRRPAAVATAGAEPTELQVAVGQDFRSSAPPAAGRARPVSRPAPERAPAVAARRSAPSPRSARTVDLTQPGKWSEQHAPGVTPRRPPAVEEPVPQYEWPAGYDEAVTREPITRELMADLRDEADELRRDDTAADLDLEFSLGRAVGE